MARYKLILCVLMVLTFGFWTLSFALLPLRFNQEEPKEPTTGLAGNNVGDIVWDGQSLWVSVGTKISKLTGSGEKATDWLSYEYGASFRDEDVSALWVKGDTIWLGSCYPTTYRGESIRAGNGLHLSKDDGLTWRHFETEDIFADRKGLRFPDNFTIAYDITVDRGTVWASYTSGFAVKTTDEGDTWEQILPDSTRFTFQNPNHHGQSLIAYNDTIWVGTFGGINKSVDGGRTWKNYNAALEGISGNFIPSLARQKVAGKSIIWAGTKSFNPGETDGISISQDDGDTWQHINIKSRTTNFAFEDTTGLSAWNFAFGDTSSDDTTVSESTVWVATDEGLFRTDDFGQTWEIVEIKDPDTGENLLDKRVVDVEMRQRVLWASTSEGLAKSEDAGKTWKLLRSPVRTLSLDKGEIIDEGVESENTKTYAYPNPFSPLRDESIRIQYSLSEDALVTIKIYDFASRLVRTLIRGELRRGPGNHGENWDGSNGSGGMIANGVYFYRIETDRGDEAFGKIVVLN